MMLDAEIYVDRIAEEDARETFRYDRAHSRGFQCEGRVFAAGTAPEVEAAHNEISLPHARAE